MIQMIRDPLGLREGSQSPGCVPSDDLGWSWFDVQARLRSHDVAREMERVASEPLVFVGHPIMVAHDESSDSVRDEPNILLKHFNQKILRKAEAKKLCHLLTESPFRNPGKEFMVPSLLHGLDCKIDNPSGKIMRGP